MVYFVGYAAVAIAFVLAGIQLLAPRVPLVQRLLTIKAGSISTGEPLDVEAMSYELVRFGFALLTIGLLVGSVWAKSAWGDFWVWDPKENWSLVTWLVYGGYLHLRRVRGWRGDKGAWLLIAGFAVVMFTYLGMHLLPTAEESAHVYSAQ
jgi:ABC-type transport system involved in cytochrome c biogenesis permease subunit